MLAGIAKAVVHHRRPDATAPELPLHAEDSYEAGRDRSPCQPELSFVHEVSAHAPVLQKSPSHPVSGLTGGALDERAKSSGRR